MNDWWGIHTPTRKTNDMFKSVTFFCLFAMFTTMAVAQTGIIRGNVFDEDTGEPIIYGTTCLLVSHILKCTREKKREPGFLEAEYLTGPTITLIFNKFL